MMKSLTALFAFTAVFFTTVSLFAKDVPANTDTKGKFHVHSAISNINHRIPKQYFVEVPSGKKRRGLAEHLAIGLYSNIRSLYVSREYPDSVGPVWQPSATIEAYHVGFNAWANFVLNDEPNQGEFNEVDLTLYYTLKIGNFTIHPYVLAFLFPNANPASLDYGSGPMMEADLLLRYDLWRFYFISLTRVGTVRTTGQVYSHVAVGYVQPFMKGLSLDISALLSFGNDKFFNSHARYNHTTIDAISWSICLPWKVWRGLILKPNMNFAIHIPPSLRKSIRNMGQFGTDLVWGGLDVEYDF